MPWVLSNYRGQFFERMTSTSKHSCDTCGASRYVFESYTNCGCLSSLDLMCHRYPSSCKRPKGPQHSRYAIHTHEPQYHWPPTGLCSIQDMTIENLFIFISYNSMSSIGDSRYEKEKKKSSQTYVNDLRYLLIDLGHNCLPCKIQLKIYVGKFDDIRGQARGLPEIVLKVGKIDYLSLIWGLLLALWTRKMTTVGEKALKKSC